MNTVLVVAETIALLAWVGRALRQTTPSTPPHGRRLFTIASLLFAQAALLAFFGLRVLPGLHLEHGQLQGLAWFTQFARTALVIAAFRLWLGIVGPDFADRRNVALLSIALGCFAIGAGPLPIVGFVMMSVFMGRLSWPRDLSGWRRAVVLVVGALLLAALLVSPSLPVATSGLTARFAPASKAWPPALVTGTLLSPSVRQELFLTRPFDHAVEALVDLFRVQLFVLVIQLLTLPIRLSGMSLKRRFWVNYLLVRQIPGFIGAIVLMISIYLAFGAIKAGQATRRVRAHAGSGTPRPRRRRTARRSRRRRGQRGATERLAHARLDRPGGTEAYALVREWNAAADTSGVDSLPRPSGRCSRARRVLRPPSISFCSRAPRTAGSRASSIGPLRSTSRAG